MLYKNNIKNRSDLKKIHIDKLAKIDKIGVTIAKSIKSQLQNSKK